MSPSDLKHIEHPRWIDPAKGEPTLMLFSVVDDRSGVAYQEYHCVYGEDAETALRFLFNSMAPKADPSFPFQGRPKLIYLDNGPVAKRRVFQSVMRALGIEWQTHIPASKDGTRTTARSKGKVERPFRTVKEAHETLYHFHKPETEAQANEWLLRYLVRTYNQQTHRAEPLSRIEGWITHVPTEGIREMCSWDQFCRFAREPERRKVGPDARITTDGTAYELEPEMAGDYVVLLWGCSTMSCMPSSMASGSVLTTRCPAPFRSTATGLSSAARQTSARLVSDLSRTSWGCRSRRFPGKMYD